MASGRIANAISIMHVVVFMKRCTQPVAGVWIKNSSFYEAYRKWARKNHNPVVSKMAFSKILSGHFEIPVVRKRIDNKQYTGRVGRWPGEEIREFLKIGVDYF